MKPTTNQPTHFDEQGAARMVDVTDKPVTTRSATASATVWLSQAAAEIVQAGQGRKGDVIAVARIAGIAATKWTSVLIPLCHSIPIESATVDFDWPDAENTHPIADFHNPRVPLRCVATVRTTGRTGVEMEAMTAATVAGLTVVDMLKSVDREIVIDAVRLERKEGGRSGFFQRQT